MNKVTTKIGYVFSLIGIPLLIGGLFWSYKSIKFSMSAVSVKSTVTEVVEDTCTRNSGSGNNSRSVSYTCFQPVVSYEYAGQKYTLALSERSSNKYEIGENFDLKLDPKKPQEASTNAGIWVGPIMLNLFGLIFGGIGMGLVLNGIKRKKLEAYLNANGLHIRAKVIDVGFNRSVSVNGSNPYMIRAQFNDPKTNAPIVAVADELWYDPTLSGEIAQDNTVEVIYDTADSKRCMIVLSNKQNNKAA